MPSSRSANQGEPLLVPLAVAHVNDIARRMISAVRGERRARHPLVKARYHTRQPAITRAAERVGSTRRLSV